MNLEYLKSFYITVTNNSISKAAKQLHMTQPGLSMQLQALEKDLGVNLLIRSNKGVQITEAGKILFDYANTILSLNDNITRDLDNLKTNKKQLIIGSCKAIGEYSLPCSIYLFKQDNKDLNLSLEVENTTEVINDLLNSSVDLGITQYRSNETELVFEKIVSDDIILITSMPLMKDKITLEELKRLPLIMREEGSGTRRIIKDELEKSGMNLDDLTVIFELNSNEAIKTSVTSGKGAAFIPKFSVLRELKMKTVQEIEIEGIKLSADYHIAYRKNGDLTSEENEFIRFVKSSKRGFC
ncbi:DNA-binding transcriptional LysR family regulator [Acetoanaerobium pronyense]|uniref:DNA-binding transcriptional LysR family regulator n=1 Tax=Acetoanaerobium pronyense TaxID=1482736 RepID=A0ABS4KKU4_9FIRM|nr:LysR family transcriptional regulator [Acetoanaerobium pronyense]MBP2028407.1 DNA-binding transcriptional LysR family regulator [Acetoanaerobium pronyense]